MNESGDKSVEVPNEEKISPNATAKILAEGCLIADRYQIMQKIGGGGMGVVFKAKDLILKRLVAVKVLHSSYTDQDILRFQQEARASSAFNHPNLLTVLDFGLTGGNQPYLAMEYVSGTTLAHWIKDGTLDLLKTLTILKQACDGMAKAHELNVIHRDLKPSNILLVDTADGIMQVKIIDFGIAKRTDEDQKLTTTGAGIGSPLYMSPEQVRGESVDNRSDIYSFGCVAFEMITGRVPYRGKDSLSTMTMHLTHELPSLDAFMEAVEKGKSNKAEITEMLGTLYEIISRCLAKKAQGRFHSFADVKEALVEFEENIAEQSIAELAELSPVRSRPRQLWLATGIVLIGAMAAVLVFFKIESSKHMIEVTKKDKIERQIHKGLNDVQDYRPFLTDIEKTPLFGYSPTSEMKELKPSREFDLAKIRKEVDKGNAECLDLGYCVIKGKELEALAGCNLKGIRLTSNPLSPEAFVQLAKIPSLQFIDLAKSDLTVESALYPLAKLKKLDTLILDGNKFDGSVFGPIVQMSNLDCLSMNYCPLNGEVPGQKKVRNWMNQDDYHNH